MKKGIITTAFFFLCYAIGGGQALNKTFLNSTVYISFKTPTKYSVGTGFLVLRKVDHDKGHIFLITNKHVLPKEGKTQSITVRVNTQSGDKLTVREIEILIVGKDGKYLSSVLLHPKEKFDVAAIHITEEVIKHNIIGAWIPYSLFATKEILLKENITVGDEIFLLGYPGAIYDPRNISPVLRQGIISTMPSEGYTFNRILRQKFNLPGQIDGFLIDANVFPGSSGSLVIFKQQPVTIGSGGGALVSRKKLTPYLLGIISGSIPIEDFGRHQRMGLGIVYSADSIKETIEQFYD